MIVLCSTLTQSPSTSVVCGSQAVPCSINDPIRLMYGYGVLKHCAAAASFLHAQVRGRFVRRMWCAPPWNQVNPIVVVHCSTALALLISHAARTRPTMKSPPAPSPLLPWEGIERVISHSCDSDRHPEAIRNFSLTCRELRLRSLCLLVADLAFLHQGQDFRLVRLSPGQPSSKASRSLDRCTSQGVRPRPPPSHPPKSFRNKVHGITSQVSPSYTNPPTVSKSTHPHMLSTA